MFKIKAGVHKPNLEVIMKKNNILCNQGLTLQMLILLKKYLQEDIINSVY